MTTITCLIRCRDSARTLPSVLASLRSQTRQPDCIVAVDNASTDATAEILVHSGAIILPWAEAYSHPRVLNYGIRNSPPTDYVLVVSSHTALADPHIIEHFAAALDADAQAAAVSLKWGDDCYSDAITGEEFTAKGMRLCSIYTNSLGMMRRSHWAECPFDEAIPTAEDYDWSLSQLAQGRSILRLSLPFDYPRRGYCREYELTRALFRIANKHGQRLVWLGPQGTLQLIAAQALLWLRQPSQRPAALTKAREHFARLRAWAENCIQHSSPCTDPS